MLKNIHQHQMMFLVNKRQSSKKCTCMDPKAVWPMTFVSLVGLSSNNQLKMSSSLLGYLAEDVQNGPIYGHLNN